MNLNDLKIFIATAEHGNLTRAAAITNTVQSNVSARIKSLEQSFDLQLFIRNTRNVELTEEGILFLKLAKEITISIDDFKVNVAKQKLNDHGLIKIGCLQTTAALRAPAIFSSFTKKHPKAEFKLKTGTTAHLIKEVLTYKLDGSFVSGKVEHPDLDVCAILREELCIVYSSTYSDFEKLVKNSKQIKAIVFNKGCSYRQMLIELLDIMEAKVVKTFEMDTLEGIINTVESGSGITLLPYELIRKHYSYRNLSTWKVSGKHSEVLTVFVKRKDFPMSEMYTLFFQSIKSGYTQDA